MFSLQAEGLHGNHKDINAYHRTDYQYILIQFIYPSALRLKQLPISSPHATIRLPLFRIALNICKKFIPYIKSYFLMRGISLLYYGKGTY